ncbi:multicopper oxidase domain-containing protein [Actinospica durhamensis]|uniref:Multicopper oxidase domain-containing protein n=1 Tax=Actinospica durhamensis TaxID=1508375 RepID=A0A941EVA4_9ACTN|nr:multicopper oxidase family protein [Actinospica durhamensis]MBR7837093.1 multicopper oxidase domain-containing protein [Actinospica durhamensis]
MENSPRISRRSMLKAVPAAATLVAAPDVLLAAPDASAAAGTFPQPPVWSSSTKILDRTLDVRLSQTDIPGFGRATTRAYNRMIPGPTLRLRGGDTLRLTQINALPPNPPFNGDHDTPHDFNSFNLHTHGLHVSPSGEADNVFREFAPRTAADPVTTEPRYVSTIGIPANHPAGTFWYHPHYHGAVSMQLAGGMAGVLIIEGDIDEVPEIAVAADIVVCVNELKLRDGQVPEFTSDGALTDVPSVFTVNGAVNPVLTMRPGEVQRWRLVAATGFTRLPLQLTSQDELGTLEMHQIAQDGITFPAPVYREEVALGMGNRADVLVRASEPGVYELRRSQDSAVAPLMTIVVEGRRVEPPMRLPYALPQGKPFINESAVTDPGFHREIVFTVNANVFEQPFPNAYRILGTHPTPPADPAIDPLLDHQYGRFDPEFVNHHLRLGTVERWVISPTANHPFHLHTNHFLVTHRNGVALDPPVWQDTLSVAETATILAKYEDFTGLAVLHCHNLKHEDLGMMQAVEFLRP